MNQSKSATGDAAAALLNANMPILASAGIARRAADRVQVVPSVEYAPVTFVPSDIIRR